MGQGQATLVVTGSVHGQLDPCGWKKKPLGGLSRKLVSINTMRQEGSAPVILDAGDLFFSTSVLDGSNRVSEQFRAIAILKGYEKIGCDAINVGQYELSEGIEILLESEQKSKIHLISAILL